MRGDHTSIIRQTSRCGQSLAVKTFSSGSHRIQRKRISLAPPVETTSAPRLVRTPQPPGIGFDMRHTARDRQERIRQRIIRQPGLNRPRRRARAPTQIRHEHRMVNRITTLFQQAPVAFQRDEKPGIHQVILQLQRVRLTGGAFAHRLKIRQSFRLPQRLHAEPQSRQIGRIRLAGAAQRTGYKTDYPALGWIIVGRPMGVPFTTRPRLERAFQPEKKRAHRSSPSTSAVTDSTSRGNGMTASDRWSGTLGWAFRSAVMNVGASSMPNIVS